eukprot:TRINITY_DN2922_c0_g1_i1.p1 TRINITY_DN2922_c0_g1~~TRINITY_DN2922_c0_g1_i1.p1  ORF type:complete len:403 (-),score=76.25 TRINITY_DN2922_c0_g1_i1:537-1745(-)
MEVDMNGDCQNELEFDRSVDQVKDVIQLAKLDESELYSYSQVISFSPQLYGDEVKLIHVNKSMADSLQEGDSVHLRGSEDENLVLCSKDKTYDFKEAETSNSMLILPELKLAKECEKHSGERTLAWRNVSGIFFKYFELQEIRPRLQKLRTALQTLTESNVRKCDLKAQSFEDLLDCIQASETELRQGLKDLETVCFRGGWFLPDLDYKIKIVSHLVKFFDDNSWKLDCVYKQETVDTLADLVDKEILSQVFDFYCSPMQGGTDDEFSVEKEKISRLFGNYLLTQTSTFAYNDFMDIWEKSVPEGIKVDISHLAGLALVEQSGSSLQAGSFIKSFPEENLPNSIQERLEVLFSARERWSVEEVTPYIQPLTTPKLNVNALLTKYARPVTVQGVKYFCAKHGK